MYNILYSTSCLSSVLKYSTPKKNLIKAIRISLTMVNTHIQLTPSISILLSNIC